MLPSPLAVLSPGLGFLDRTLSSFRCAPAFSMPSRLVAWALILSGFTSYVSGCESGFTEVVVSAKGTLWRFAFGC